MSGIAGIVRFDGPHVETALIQKLTAAMKRRGPDEQTHWFQGPVALGHCMLRTTPESLDERQPLANHDGDLVLVWDGRIDNRKSLGRDLLAAGARLRDRSDAELALQSYATWGEKAPERLLGDFAFAVWDRRQGKLFCARDPMGARPLFYTRNDRFFAFASEEEVLTVLPGVSGRPNEERIAYALVPGFEDFDYSRSWLEDVRTLMPGHTLDVSLRGTIDIASYWELAPGEETQYASDAECREAFLEVFGEAVRCRMRASGDVSAMMSGGLDSAGIAAMVKRLLPGMPGKAFHTYSAVSDQPETCIETRSIQSLTRDLGERAHFVAVPSFTGMADVQDLIEAAWSKPHPVDNSILLPAVMALSARRNGQRVMLHGASGDLTMHAPLHYASYLLRDNRWARAWRECSDASRNNNYLRNTAPALLFTKALWHAYLPGRARSTLQGFRERLIGPPLQKRIPLDLRLPWFSWGAIRYLQEHIKPGMKVFEWGSGGSTLFFADRHCDVYSFEDNLRWHTLMYEKASSTVKQITLQHIPYDFNKANFYNGRKYRGRHQHSKST